MDAIGPIVAVLSFVYMLLWGRKSIGEILESRKQGHELARNNAAAAATTGRVFISYSRRDLAFVEPLVWDLRAAGLEVWYDLAGLEVGSRWGKEIQNAIRQSQYCLVVLTPNSVESEWVEREFLYASKLRLKIIPILQSECEIPLWAINLEHIDMQGRKYQDNRQALLRALDVPSPRPSEISSQERAVLDAGGPAARAASWRMASAGLQGLPASDIPPKVRHRWMATASILALGLLAVMFTAANLLGLLPTSRPAPAVVTATPTIAPATLAAASPVAVTAPAPTADPLIRRALIETANADPLYKTGFDYWGDFWQPGAGVKIANGALIASSGSGFAGARVSVLTTREFAYAFAFRMPDASGNHGPCESLTTNGLFESSKWKGFDILFQPYGHVELGRNLWPGNYERIGISDGRFNFSNFNTVTVIVLGKQIAIYVNAQPALAALDPEGSDVYTEQSLGAYQYQVCEFDNFKLWDLTDIQP